MTMELVENDIMNIRDVTSIGGLLKKNHMTTAFIEKQFSR